MYGAAVRKCNKIDVGEELEVGDAPTVLEGDVWRTVHSYAFAQTGGKRPH